MKTASAVTARNEIQNTKYELFLAMRSNQSQHGQAGTTPKKPRTHQPGDEYASCLKVHPIRKFLRGVPVELSGDPINNKDAPENAARHELTPSPSPAHQPEYRNSFVPNCSR